MKKQFVRHGTNPGRCLGLFLGVAGAGLLSAPAWADGGHDDAVETSVHERELSEPFFVAKSTPETELEFEFEYENLDDEDEIGLGFGGSLVVFDRLQLGVEVPVGIRMPHEAPAVAAVGDVEFSALYQFFNPEDNGFSLAILGEVAAPTGDEDKEIGETGSWGVFGTGGFMVPLDPNGTELELQFQAGFEQQIRLTSEQREEAADLGASAVREQEIVWGAAASVPLAGGAFIPTIEVVGHTVVRAIDEAEEGTIIEIGGGVWWSPFPAGPLEDLVVGLAAKAPVSRMNMNNVTALFVTKIEFD